MALCIAYFGILNAVGAFIGASIGGFVSSMHFNFLGLNSILFIFLLSGIMRFIAIGLFYSRINEVRKVKKLDIRKKITDNLRSIFPISLRLNSWSKSP